MDEVFELCVVVPVFNEESNIRAFVSDWHDVLTSKNILFRILVIDDGSTDESPNILRGLQERTPRLQVIRQTNAGHGQAILKGYALALSDPWILQLDADHQWSTDAFDQLWKNKHDFDLLMGIRQSLSSIGSGGC